MTEPSNIVSVENSISLKDYLFVRALPQHPVVHVAFVSLIFTVLFEAMSFLTWHSWLDYPYLIEAIVMYPCLFYFGMRSTYKRTKDQLQATITLTSDHIITKTLAGAAGKYEWRTVYKVIQKHGATIIQVSRKPDYYFWISNRCFSSPDAAEEFFLTAKEHWENLRFSPLPEISFETPVSDHTTSVDVDLKFRELLICNYYLFKVVVAIGLFFLAFVFGEILLFHTAYGALSNGLPALACLLCPAIITWLRVRNHPEWMTGRLSISDDELKSEGKEGGIFAQLKWSSVKKMVQWNDMLLLTMDNKFTLCIPLRCFPSHQVAERFCRNAREYWQEARSNKPSIPLK
jgi:hypothetical protein